MSKIKTCLILFENVFNVKLHQLKKSISNWKQNKKYVDYNFCTAKHYPKTFLN